MDARSRLEVNEHGAGDILVRCRGRERKRKSARRDGRVEGRAGEAQNAQPASLK